MTNEITLKMKEILLDFSRREGILLGTCDAAPLTAPSAEPPSFTPFVSSKFSKRTDPRAALATVQGVAVMGVAYNNWPRPVSPDRGLLSTMGAGEDYHRRVRALLEELADRLRAVADFEYKILADSPQLMERAWAVRAGLGAPGKHQSVISRKLGSLFNIGLLLASVPLPFFSAEDKAIKTPEGWISCDSCNACVRACPGKALDEEGGFQTERCVSFCNQSKEGLTPDQMAAMGNRVYGCDLCQEVCPFNRQRRKEAAPAQAAESLSPSLSFLAGLSEEDFDRLYRHTSAAWMGRNNFRRNALIAMGNSGNLSYLALLESVARDQREDGQIKDAALWAAAKLRGGDGEKKEG